MNQNNQTNQDQPITPAPAPEPTPSPTPTSPPGEKNSASKKPFMLMGVVTVLIALVITVVYFRTNTAQRASAAPDASTFYAGTLDNKKVLFFKVTGMTMSGMPENPYSGMYVAFENAAKAKYHMGNTADYRKLKDPQKLFAFDRYASIENFKLNDDESQMMISFSGGNKDNMNYIYQVDLKSRESKKIWEHELFKGEAPYNGGTPYIVDFIPDKYVAFSMLKGDPPPVTIPSGVVVKNIQSGAERNLGAVDEVKINVTDNTVSFKKLGNVKVPCLQPKDPKCFATDTYKMVNGTTGDAISEPLP